MNRLLSFWVLLLALRLGNAQTPPTKTPPPKPAAQKPASTAQPKEKPSAGKAPAKLSPRMEKIKGLTFDRRPSALLNAWSKAAEKPEKAKTSPDPLDAELAAWQRQVTRGLWGEVKSYLAKLPKDESKPAYRRLVESLQSGPAGSIALSAPGGPGAQQFMEKNYFAAEDVLGLAFAAPHPLEKDDLKRLGAIAGQAIQAATVADSVVARFQKETARPARQAGLTKRQAAVILTEAGQAAETGLFLPALKQAEDGKDHEALNLLARHFLAQYYKDKKTAFLEKAWSAIQSALALQDAPKAEREKALRQAVELAAKIRKELGQNWLEKSFTRQPKRGMEILATIGALTAQGLQTNPMNVDSRQQELVLQKTAVEALLKAAPSKANEWKNTLALLAANWLREAEFSYQFDQTTSLGPRMRYDPYGNIYFANDPMAFNPMMSRQPNQPLPVAIDKILETRPGKSWLGLLGEGPRTRLAKVFAQLFLKVNEETQAFPYIETMARVHPDEARKLVNDFLRVWTRNHDPNSQRMQRSPYFYIWGFNRQAEGISLTRSQQERNLLELADWVARLRQLPIGDPDEELLAKAFTTSHSSAEVYRLEAIAKVFGPIGGLKPRTLAGLLQQMRANLAGLWRRPDEQDKKKTNRKQKDIQREVVRGYALAQAVTDGALKKFPNDWSLTLARAALLHDENQYRQELSKSSKFSQSRRAALAAFHQAARLYAVKVKNLPRDEESIQVFNQWFYASLGAVDLAQMDEEKLPDAKQIPLIRQAILGLPGAVAERHLTRFVNDLITHLNSVKPAVKFRYLSHGLEIAGDHKHAHEARKVFNYYKDLVTEIKLRAQVDGDAVVGHTRPFGVFVNLRHTREIEREAGGFGRYLQNQNSMSFYYNFGRPNADYRDRFQAAVTEALKEHFEVLSVTFQTDKVNSRATEVYGWRLTPYAYLLLKARGPRVDKIPPLRIDLDFTDTGGYVIIPIESPAVPIDAAAKIAPARPLKKLKIIQSLDERQADKGKLLLEVKASALGLIGELEDTLPFDPEGFQISKRSNPGVSVAKFDEHSADPAVISERTWILTLEAKPGQIPRKFHVGKVKGNAEMTYQRYLDADLINASQEVDLEAHYGQVGYLWLWRAGAAALLVLALLGFLMFRVLRRPAQSKEARWELPKHLTPFTVLGFLNGIDQTNHLAEPEKVALKEAIVRLERHYFSKEGNGSLDLRSIAETWRNKGDAASGACQRPV